MVASLELNAAAPAVIWERDGRYGTARKGLASREEQQARYPRADSGHGAVRLAETHGLRRRGRRFHPLDAIVMLRNDLAHGSDRLMSIGALEMMELCAEVINRLFLAAAEAS